MTPLLILLALLMAVVVTLVTCLQVLYLESLRIRARELPSLEFFKATLEAKRQAAEKAEREAQAQREAARQRDARLAVEEKAVDAHLASLTPEERAKLEREVLANSDPNLKMFAKRLVKDHVKKLLGMEDY